jgi:hypothetical protein
VAGAYALWALWAGVHVAVDTPTYARWADLLIALNFNVVQYLREQSFVAPPITYVSWIVVLAVLKSVAGASWLTAVVVVNWIALAGGALATIAAVRKVTLSSAAMLMAAALFVVAGDLLIFVPYVLSDLMFWGLSTAVLACGTMVVVLPAEERASFRRLAITGSALLIVALMFRPVAAPLALFWILALAVSAAPALFGRFVTATRVAAAVLAFIAAAVHAYVLTHPQVWPFGSLPPILSMVADEYRQGMFVHNANPPLLVAPAVDWLGFMRMTVQKLMFFVTPWLPHYSAAHTVINLLFFLPAYGFAIAAISNFKRLPPEQRRAACLLGTFAILLSAFHSLLLLDSDHRYRLPLLPALIMLAAIGLEAVRRPQMLSSIARVK